MRAAFERLSGRYAIVGTRDLDAAKAWVREKSRGSERYGLLASSNAFRLKPHAIDVRAKINPIHWFLNDKDDTRSSWYLEDAATEFQVQGSGACPAECGGRARGACEGETRNEEETRWFLGDDE